MLSLSGTAVHRPAATAAAAADERLPAIDGAAKADDTSAATTATAAFIASPPRGSNSGAHTERSHRQHHKQSQQQWQSQRRLTYAPAPLPSVLPHFPVAAAASASIAAAQPRHLSKLLAQAERDQAEERKSTAPAHSASTSSLQRSGVGPGLHPPASLSASASAAKFDLRSLIAGPTASESLHAVHAEITRLLERILDEHTAALLSKFQQDLMTRAKREEKQQKATAATAAALSENTEATSEATAAAASTAASTSTSALQQLADWTPALPAASSAPAASATSAAAPPLTSRDRARLAWFERQHPALQSTLKSERRAWQDARKEWAASYEGLAAKYTALLGHTNNISAVLKEQKQRNEEMERTLQQMQQQQQQQQQNETNTEQTEARKQEQTIESTLAFTADALTPAVPAAAAAAIISSVSRRSSATGSLQSLSTAVAAAAAAAPSVPSPARPLPSTSVVDSASQTPAQWRATFALQFASMLPAHTNEDEAAADASAAAAGSVPPMQPLMEQTMRAYELEAARMQQQQQTEDDHQPGSEGASPAVPRSLHIDEEGHADTISDPTPVTETSSRDAVASLVSAILNPAHHGSTEGDVSAAATSAPLSSRRKSSKKKRASGQVSSSSSAASLSSPLAASGKSKRSSMRAPRALDKSASTASISSNAAASTAANSVAAAVLSPSSSAALLPAATSAAPPAVPFSPSAASGVTSPQVTFRSTRSMSIPFSDSDELAQLASGSAAAAAASTTARSSQHQLLHRRDSNNPLDSDRFSDGGFSSVGVGGGGTEARAGEFFGSTRGSSPTHQGHSAHGGLSPSLSSSTLRGGVTAGSETLATLSDRWKSRLLAVKVSLARAESKNEALVQLLRGSDERNLALADAVSKLKAESQAQGAEVAALQKSHADLSAQLRLAQQNKPKKELQSALSSAETELLACRAELTTLRAQQIEFKRTLFQVSSLRNDLSRAWAKTSRAEESQQKWRGQMEQALSLVTVLQSELISTKESHHADLRRLKKRLVLKSIWFRTQITKLERLHELSLLLDHYLKPELSCPGCLEVFQFPQSLSPCGHSLCAKCVQNQKQMRGAAGGGGGGGGIVSSSSSSNNGNGGGDKIECVECHRSCDSSAPNLTLESVLSRYSWWVLLLRDFYSAKQQTLQQERELRDREVKEPAPQKPTAAAAAAASNRTTTSGPPRAVSPTHSSSSSASSSPRASRTRFSGSIIRDLRSHSGTNISIADPDPLTPDERVVTITGSPAGIQTAVYLIRQCVESYVPPQQQQGGGAQDEQAGQEQQQAGGQEEQTQQEQFA